ncbi:MAG: crossover junction endodeoxyribonuclease RuvC [Saprospiraceae bacterium]|nr:crossover junction endodeoxyribonuclease RuvC [Saprospiraceae bacterium]
MKILGIDPGTNLLGFALIEAHQDVVKVLDVGTIQLSGHRDHQTKLKEIFLQLQEIIETFLPAVMAIEAPFYGKNVQSMLKLGRAQGVAMAAAMTMGLQIAEYSPKKVKQSVTGNGNAAKEQVAAMLEHLISYPVQSLGLDASDALAVAYCHYLKLNSPAPGRSTRSYGSWKSFIKENPDRVD